MLRMAKRDESQMLANARVSWIASKQLSSEAAQLCGSARLSLGPWKCWFSGALERALENFASELRSLFLVLHKMCSASIRGAAGCDIGPLLVTPSRLRRSGG